MNEKVGKAKFEGIENAYILISAYIDKEKQALDGHIWSATKPSMSFFYDAGEVGAEWMPPYGPLQIWYKDTDNKQKKHYFYDYVKDKPLAWSQLAADENHFCESFADGDYEHIFNVLKRWALSHKLDNED